MTLRLQPTITRVAMRCGCLRSSVLDQKKGVDEVDSLEKMRKLYELQYEQQADQQTL